MRFELTEDQRDFAAALDALVAASDPVGVARAWGAGDTAPGLKLWERLAEQGVTALATEASPIDLVVAFEVLGKHALPGPWVESAAYLPLALGREVAGVGTVTVPPQAEGLDADVADEAYIVLDGELYQAAHHAPATSVDPTRRLFDSSPTEPVDAADLAGAYEFAVLATSAQLLGLGERVLADSVTYVQQRTQFGRPIGSYQAIKHMLADVRIALDFARPLLFGAALSLGEGSRDGCCATSSTTEADGCCTTSSTTEADGCCATSSTTGAAVSAAKVQCAEAAYLASRVGLQVHGAIGYTEEYDLSVFLTKIRALVTAWGTPAFHRARILQSLAPSTSSGTE